jgi:tripartite ATP-independent transporter DctM subunit
MSSEMIGLIGLGATIALMFCKVPLGVVFTIVGGAGTLIFTSFAATMSNFQTVPYIWTTQYTFSCLPMFILLGLIIGASDIAKDLYAAAYKWLGRLPGGLSMTTLVVTAIFSALSGSAIAAVSTIALVCYPEMKRFGYDSSLASGVIASGATMAIMIPPSIPMIIYVMISDVSIGKMFLAGFIPGFVEVLVFCLFILIMVKRKPSLAPISKDVYSWIEKLKGLKGIIPFITIFILMFGGLYGGVFTPTEAGAAGVIASTLVCLVLKRLNGMRMKAAIFQTVHVTGNVFLILIGVMLFNTFIALSGLGTQLSQWVVGIGISPMIFLLVVMLLYIPLGALMEEISMILLTVPLYMPSVQTLGIDPILFGILIMLSWQIGMIAPPVGMIAFVAKSTLKEVTINEVYKGCLPFLFGLILIQLLVLVFPDVALFPLRFVK